ncbi:MAG: imidazole glycerol phosphate synthase subunit HisF [Spirochaetaceae bacterium]|jgi:cyclase|nr:imidazole glycerol phosphate synthase subunit HisF [Spirochaetaceae bacterium]
MLKKRIVICLDVRDGRTTKGVKFQNNVDVGDPVEMAAAYYRQGVDELVFYDIVASVRGRGPILDVVARVAAQVFIPFCVGGGMGTLEDIRNTILAGAEKISLNTQAVKQPALITAGARVFGNQCIVLGMDAKRDAAMTSGYRVFVNGGRTPTDWDARDWAIRAVELGAGEIVLNSIDADGTRDGYEIPLTRLIAQAVPVPVVASGGGGKSEHLVEVLTTGGADAALVASMVHSGEYTVGHIKAALSDAGVLVREDAAHRTKICSGVT